MWDRMDDSQRECMQHHKSILWVFLSLTIDRVSKNGTPQMREMNPDLVGSPGMESQPDKRHVIPLPQYEVIGAGMLPLALLPHSEPLSIYRITYECGVDMTSSFGHPAMHDGDIIFFGGAFGELLGKCGMRSPAFRNHHHSRGILVQTMDDTRSHRGFLIILIFTFGSGRREELGTIAEHQCMYKGIVVVSRTGMDHKRLLLVDHKDVVVLIQDGERDVAALDGIEDFFHPSHFHMIATLNGSTFFHRFSVQGEYGPCIRRSRTGK
jgi:hypothetical protein